MKEMSERRVHVDVLNCWDKDWDRDGLRLMTQLIKSVRETGEWLKDFTDDTVIALEKKPNGTKWSDQPTVSLMVHTVKTVGRMLTRRIERKIEEVYIRISLGLEEVKELAIQLGC